MSSSLARIPAAALRFKRVPTSTSMVFRRGVRAGGPGYTGVPLDYTNKTALKIKFIAFFGSGFALPFIATYYQMWKSGNA
ncbi:hypothetical protein DENSPDRAFT_884308 [Dentipellis sp. KUC8613]|nr:hypothetical protein DENSPDRAFT_884308 [Dentipellis sp. KUC8613]